MSNYRKFSKDRRPRLANAASFYTKKWQDGKRRKKRLRKIAKAQRRRNRA